MRNAIYKNDTDRDREVCTIFIQNMQSDYGTDVDENKLCFVVVGLGAAGSAREVRP